MEGRPESGMAGVGGCHLLDVCSVIGWEVHLEVEWESRMHNVGTILPCDSPPALPDLSLPYSRDWFLIGSEYLQPIRTWRLQA